MKIERDERRFDFHDIGLAIKRAREASGMTQEQLAYIVDRAPRTIMYNENDGQHPSLNTFYQRVTMFDISVDQYFYPSKNRGSECRKISLADLGNYPLISLGTSTKSFEFYSAFFTEHGLPYSPDIEAATADQILPMAQADLGVGFVPEEFVNPSDNVRIIDLEEEIPERSICLIKRKEQPLSVAAKELERMIIELASGE